jgi:hypothetical protein
MICNYELLALLACFLDFFGLNFYLLKFGENVAQKVLFFSRKYLGL